MSRRNKYTILEVKKHAISRGGQCLSTTYKNNKTNLEWQCGECKHKWCMSFKPILLLGNWCPKCSGRLNNDIENIRKLALSRGGKCLSTTYKNNKTNLEWQCGKCSRKWLARLDRVKSGTWCPHCRRSHGERAIQIYLDSNNITYTPEYTINLKNMRFDFYLPDFNIAIEYDGVQHFQIHNKYTPNLETLYKRQHFDVEKTNYCIHNNITLVRIHYKSLNNISYILKNIFAHKDKLIFTHWMIIIIHKTHTYTVLDVINGNRVTIHN